MTVLAIHKDPDALTMRVDATFAAPVARVWEIWSDPRQLERWWGPPSHPATFVDHDLSPGGKVTYFMTGPEGDRYHGWWRVTAVDAPRRLEVEDGFADGDGVPLADMPVTTMVAELADDGSGGTAMTVTSHFASAEAMARLLEMQMDEGMRQAMGQIDALLAPAPA